VEILRRSFEANNAFMRGDLSSEAFAQLFDPQRVLGFTHQSGRGRRSGVPLGIHFFESGRSEMEWCADSSTSAIAPTPLEAGGLRE